MPRFEIDFLSEYSGSACDKHINVPGYAAMI
jgi:hypothetical protein